MQVADCQLNSFPGADQYRRLILERYSADLEMAGHVESWPFTESLVDAAGYAIALQSKTFFDTGTREKGEEVADYSQAFDSTGLIIKTETVYIYEGDLDAADASAEDLMIQSDTFRHDGIVRGTLKTSTIYHTAGRVQADRRQ